MNLERYLERFWSDEYDCWGLVRDYLEHEQGIQIPRVPVDAHDPRAVRREFEHSPVRDMCFEKLEAPVDGCVVEMGRNGRACHVGIWFEGRVLHNHYAGGVAFEPTPPFEILGYYAARSTAAEPAQSRAS